MKLTSIEQLRDTLAKITSKKIELSYLDKRISFDDFKYYIYNASKLGWTNVDCFAGDPSRKVTVKVNIKVQANISCKLLFKDSRSLIAAEKHNEMFEFPGVPKNKRGLLIAIKYEDGKPFLAMKEIVVTSSSFDLDWRLRQLIGRDDKITFALRAR